MYDSLGSIAETITTLESNYTPKKKKKKSTVLLGEDYLFQSNKEARLRVIWGRTENTADSRPGRSSSNSHMANTGLRLQRSWGKPILGIWRLGISSSSSAS